MSALLLALWALYVAWLFIDPFAAMVTGMVVGACAFWVFWFWMHTWPLHAWSDDPHSFLKLLWRRLTCRR
jgi:hypothetical protein